MKYAQPENKKIIKTTIKLSAIILISTLTINANAQLSPNDIKQLAQNTQADSMHKYSSDGKIKYEYQIKTGADGKPELVTKKSYLPAVTDGKIIDKTRSYKLALNAKKFAKYLGKGAGYATFAQMAIDILGAGVDYVLDPKNNSVQISRPNNNVVWNVGSKTYNTAHDACIGFFQQSPAFASNKRYIDVRNIGDRHNNGIWIADCYYEYIDNHSKNFFNVTGRVKSSSPDVKVMSEEEFAKEVLKAAATQNNDKAKKVVIDYAKQEIINGDHDDVINEIVNDINSDTNTQPNPTDNPTDNKDTDNNANANPQTDKPKSKDEEGGGFELPPFCSWASKVCDFIDWFKDDDLPKNELPPIDIKDLPIDQSAADKKYYDAKAQCPPPEKIALAFGTIDFDYTNICNFFTKIAPFIMASAYLTGAFIVLKSNN